MTNSLSLLWGILLLSWASTLINSQEPTCNYANCLACAGDTLAISCPGGHVVTGFVMAGFRESFDSSCTPQDDDCFAEPISFLHEIAICMWKSQSCSFSLSAFDFARDGKCSFSMLAKYLTTSQLECQKPEHLHQICTKTDHVISIESNTRGYILSPQFPQPYAGYISMKEHCSITIATSNGLGIHLSSVYMDVKQASKGCEDYIKVSWTENGQEQETTHCGLQPVDIRIPESYAMLSLHSTDITNTNQGFAIQYSVFELPDTTPSDAIDMNTTPGPTTTTTTTDDPKTPPVTSDADADDVLSVVTVAAISTAGAVFILLLLVCIGTIVMCSRKKRQQFSPQNLNEISTESMTDASSMVGYV